MSVVGSHLHAIMQEAGFATWDTAHIRHEIVEFEDTALVGLAAIFASPEQLLTEWQAVEASFLAKHAQRLRLAGDKAWNVYCVLLSTGRASDESRRTTRWIEENLERSRKITACEVQTRDDVLTALLPLLPIVATPVLEAEDPSERLRRRIVSIAPGVEIAALDTAISPEEVARMLAKPT